MNRHHDQIEAIGRRVEALVMRILVAGLRAEESPQEPEEPLAERAEKNGSSARQAEQEP